MKHNTPQAVAVTAALLALSAACGVGDSDPNATSSNSGAYPVTVDNCGRSVTIERQPTRVVALGPSEVTSLYAAGGADKLVGRDDAGQKSKPYPAEIRDAVAAVPQFGAGGGAISLESLVALKPDLVVGSVSETISPETLASVGIPMLNLRGNCGSDHAPGDNDGTADFDDLYSDVTTFGTVLGTATHASGTIADMRERVERVRAASTLRGTTAAAVIIFKNSLEVYGARSMTHTQFSHLGIEDVFAGTDSRVFETSIEELISRDPDLLVVLSYSESDDETRRNFLSIPGTDKLKAVRNNALFVQPYELSSQGVLSVDGLENMAQRLPQLVGSPSSTQ